MTSIENEAPSALSSSSNTPKTRSAQDFLDDLVRFRKEHPFRLSVDEIKEMINEGRRL